MIRPKDVEDHVLWQNGYGEKVDVVRCNLGLKKSPRECRENITMHNSFELLRNELVPSVNPKERWEDVLEIAEEKEVVATMKVQLLDGLDNGLLVGRSNETYAQISTSSGAMIGYVSPVVEDRNGGMDVIANFFFQIQSVQLFMLMILINLPEVENCGFGVGWLRILVIGF